MIGPRRRMCKPPAARRPRSRPARGPLLAVRGQETYTCAVDHRNNDMAVASGSRGIRLARGIGVALCWSALTWAVACAGDSVGLVQEPSIKEADRLEVDIATNRQMQIGYQIASVSQADNPLDLCFEMCNRSAESCHLSANVCNVAKRYPRVMALEARCDVTRERCRVHRTKVPRQCVCE